MISKICFTIKEVVLREVLAVNISKRSGAYGVTTKPKFREVL